MIIGFLKPTSGTIKIELDGATYDLSNPMDAQKVRSEIGVCHQSDILFDQLSPAEHISFFLDLKFPSMPKAEKLDRVAMLLSDVGLTEKADARAISLSGGQKRALSLAISLVGDPKILLLDEPTTGMDVRLTQNIWSLLEKLKKERVILLTTHSMEEADILSSRICVISKGNVQALGSSMFLKSKYSAGYKLVFDLAGNLETDGIKTIVGRHFPDADSEQHDDSLVFSLQRESLEALGKFFQELNTEMGSLSEQVCNVTLKTTTLESVFLKLKENEK